MKLVQMRAKLKVEYTVKTGEESETLIMSPVTTGSEENKSFAKWTPWGKLELGISNPDLVGSFNPGDEFIVDFTRAE
jgi:hypothetical protein